ncbi:DNA polymerase [Salmonella phage 21]|nr:DNA polymerase [Salmonella phage 21]
MRLAHGDISVHFQYQLRQGVAISVAICNVYGVPHRMLVNHPAMSCPYTRSGRGFGHFLKQIRADLQEQ